jgi:hypothetical protein
MHVFDYLAKNHPGAHAYLAQKVEEGHPLALLERAAHQAANSPHPESALRVNLI